MERDASLDTLLELNGTVLVVDPEGHHWVKIVVHRVPASAARPHGIAYALTLHDRDGHRILGYDNAHPVRRSAGPGGAASATFDHRHRTDTVRPYPYRTAARLLEDFWTDVWALLTERGVKL